MKIPRIRFLGKTWKFHITTTVLDSYGFELFHINAIYHGIACMTIGLHNISYGICTPCIIYYVYELLYAPLEILMDITTSYQVDR